MAYVSTTRNELAFGTGVVARLRRSLADLRAYHRTVLEMGVLSDRDLADLGLSRADIPAAARAAVYGR